MVPLKDYKYYLTLNYGSDLPILRRKYEEAFNNSIINCSLKLKTKIKIEEIDISDFPEQFVIKEKKLNEEKNEYILLFDIENSKKSGFDEFLVDEGITGLFSGTLIFKLEPNSDIFLFSQISPKYEEQQSLNLFFKTQEENKNNLIPGLFIIFLDKKFFSQFRDEIYEIIHIFLYSMPPGSYIQLIIDHKIYDEEPKEYNQNYIEECLKNIQTMESNENEINLYNSLKNIYESINKYDKISLSKYIYLITDGDIKDKNETLNLIEKNKNEFSIHVFGNSSNQDFIKDIATITNGTYNIFSDINQLSEKIVNDLYLFSYPFYHHFNLKTSFENINLFTLNSNNELIKSKSLLNFNYIIKGNSANKKNEFTFTMKYIQGNNNFVRQYKLKPFELPPGDELIKLYMYNYLTDKKIII